MAEVWKPEKFKIAVLWDEGGLDPWKPSPFPDVLLC